MPYLLKVRGDKLTKETENQKEGGLLRKSLYVREDQAKALKIMAALENKNEYKIVIEALDEYIPKKYVDMASDK